MAAALHLRRTVLSDSEPEPADTDDDIQLADDFDLEGVERAVQQPWDLSRARASARPQPEQSSVADKIAVVRAAKTRQQQGMKRKRSDLDDNDDDDDADDDDDDAQGDSDDSDDSDGEGDFVAEESSDEEAAHDKLNKRLVSSDDDDDDDDDDSDNDNDNDNDNDSSNAGTDDEGDHARADGDEDSSNDEDDAVAAPDQVGPMRGRRGRGRGDDAADAAAAAEAAAEEERKRKYFAKDTPGTEVTSFHDMKLSRPLLKAVAALGYTTPTPVQSKCIPLALLGRDICASAVTGSGKTAAFVLPLLERLLYRPMRVAATRVLILLPTRELAVQCESVIRKLAQFTNITVALVVGGLSSKVQESNLRARPDIVVATPGRLVDHLLNARSIALEDVSVLVLDEADRLLELGFTDEVAQIVQACPKSRQTLLFSATMTSGVDALIKLSLSRPLRVTVDTMMATATQLTQEFVRIKSSHEGDKEAILLALVTRSFPTQTIVFFRTKTRAHRMMIVFTMAGLRAAELHGNMSQTARLEALEAFRDGTVDFLLCTDLAARGLDIIGVDTVLSFDMATSHSAYVHRVGRTARAGRDGLSVTLVTERDRPILKDVIKKAKSGQALRSRVVPPDVVATWRLRIAGWEDDIRAVHAEERQEKELRVAEMEVARSANMLEHSDEIAARPAKRWFQSERDKQRVKEAARTKMEQEALSRKEKKRLELKKRRAEKKEAAKKAKSKAGPQMDVDEATATHIKMAIRSAKTRMRSEAQGKGIKQRMVVPEPARKKQRTSAFASDATSRPGKGKGSVYSRPEAVSKHVSRNAFKSKSRHKRR